MTPLEFCPGTLKNNGGLGELCLKSGQAPKSMPIEPPNQKQHIRIGRSHWDGLLLTHKFGI
jgi:hypothetical protein